MVRADGFIPDGVSFYSDLLRERKIWILEMVLDINLKDDGPNIVDSQIDFAFEAVKVCPWHRLHSRNWPEVVEILKDCCYTQVIPFHLTWICCYSQYKGPK